MSVAKTDASGVAALLHEWFGSVQEVVGTGLFGTVPEGPHRTAVVVGILAQNARRVREAEVDRAGVLYTPVSLALAAACRRLDQRLTSKNWEAAVHSVVSLDEALLRSRGPAGAVGLDLGTPASVFKHLFDEALIDSGLAGLPSILDRENRRMALGLAINWGMRLLLAYCAQCEEKKPRSGEDRCDLAWVGGLVRPLLT